MQQKKILKELKEIKSVLKELTQTLQMTLFRNLYNESFEEPEILPLSLELDLQDERYIG